MAKRGDKKEEGKELPQRPQRKSTEFREKRTEKNRPPATGRKGARHEGRPFGFAQGWQGAALIRLPVNAFLAQPGNERKPN